VNLASPEGPDGFANGKPTMSDCGPDQAGAIVWADRVLEALDPAAPRAPLLTAHPMLIRVNTRAGSSIASMVDVVV
jgi:hypothetical protein